MCEWMSCREWCDVRLLCGGRAFSAHRAVLASVSAFLRQILLSCPTEEYPTFIVLPDFDIDAMSSVLYYIYNGEVVVQKHKMDTFLDIINTMQIFIDSQYLPHDPKSSVWMFQTCENKLPKLQEEIMEGCSKTKKMVKIKKGQQLQDILQQHADSIVCDNHVLCQNWSRKRSPCIENLQMPYEDRQRNCFLRDLFIEAYPRNGNVNGRAAGVLAMSSEHYRAPTSALSPNANRPHQEAEDQTADLSHGLNNLNARHHDPICTNVFTEQKLNPTQINLISLFGNFHSSSMTEQSTLKYNSQTKSSYLDFRITSDSNTLDNYTANMSMHIPLVTSFGINKRQDTQQFGGNCIKNLSVKKAAILNHVLESPWCPRKLDSYRPSRKKSDEIYSAVENSAEVKGIDMANDSNNNIQLQQQSKTNKAEIEQTEPLLTTLSIADDYKCRASDQALPAPEFLSADIIKHSAVRYTCTECPKTFSQLRNYKYHMSVHRGTREFAATCPDCGKYFNDRGYLSSHMKIHRNRKEYKCSQCPKSFNQRVAYNMHVRIHTGIKPHVCSECGKAFSRKMLLKQHHRTHSGERPYACAHCDKRFADRSNMTLHLRLHTGIKPFSCSLCPKSFTKKHHLKSHLNFHTGVKPYSCPRCHLAFTQSSNMRTHLKKCNAPEPANGLSDVKS